MSKIGLKYRNELYKSYKLTDADYEKKYNEDKTSYQIADYYSYTFSYTETNEDGTSQTVNEETKNNAEQTLAMLGLTISDAVNMLLCQVNLTGGLPFQVKLPAPESIIVNSKADIEMKLDEAEQDISNGQLLESDEVVSNLDEWVELDETDVWHNHTFLFKL